MNKKKKYSTIFLLTLSCLCYNLPYLSSSFYTQFLEAFQLTNTQAGLLLTMFSLTATPGYLFGGLLADKFSPKKLVVLSCLLTAFAGIALLMANGFTGMLICYLCFGLTTTFINWSALMKLIRAQADENTEGKIFGFFELCYALLGAVTNYGILIFMEKIISSVGFKGVIGIYAAMLFVVGLLIVFLTKDIKGDTAAESFKFSMVGRVLAHPVTWLNGFIVMGLFVLVTGTTYFNPYLSQVFGFSVAFASSFAIFNRSLARMLFTPLGGILLDRLKTPKLLIFTSSAMIILLLGMTFIPQDSERGMLMLIFMILVIVLLSVSRSGLYTPIPEAGIPYEIMGTAMGIASAVGYSTDLWLYTVCGNWIDQYGAQGYTRILYLFMAALIVVIVCALLLHRYEKRHLKVTAQ